MINLLILFQNFFSNSIKLGAITQIEQGSKSGKNGIFTVTKEFCEKNKFEKSLIRNNVKNGDIQRYIFFDRGNVLIYTDNNTKIEDYPNTYNYLLTHKEELFNRNEAQKGLYEWFRLDRPRNKAIFDAKEKLIVPYRAEHNRFAYDNQQFFNDGGDIRAIVLKENSEYSIKYLLALLNSSLLDWFFGFIGKTKGTLREYFNNPLSEIPIHIANLEAQQPFIDLADKMLTLNGDLQKKITRFISRIKETYGFEKTTQNLENFYKLTFTDFVKELSKVKVKLTMKQKDELEDYFNDYVKDISELNASIEATDNEINKLVYKLYNLTDEEIKIIAG